jgi:hypothetical protein
VLEGLGLDASAVLVAARGAVTVWLTAGDVLALKLASPP